MGFKANNDNRDTASARIPGTPRLRCTWCNEFKDDTSMRTDIFAVELDGDHTLYPTCDACEQTRCDDF